MNTNIIDIEGRKPNANNVLANLPPADHAQIKAWLQNHSFTATVAKINAPRPEGLGLNVHYTSVRNYYLDYVHARFLGLPACAAFADRYRAALFAGRDAAQLMQRARSTGRAEHLDAIDASFDRLERDLKR